MLLACWCCSLLSGFGGFFSPRLSGTEASFPPGIFREDVSKGCVGVADLCWLGSYREERLVQVWPYSRTLLSQLPLLPTDFLRVFLAACKFQEKLFFVAKHTVAFVQASGNGEVIAQRGCGGLHSPFLSCEQLGSVAACCVGLSETPRVMLNSC